MTAPLPQAVLWDLDGTLIDSEPFWMRAEDELMAEQGIPWSHEQSMQLVGNALPNSAAILREAGVRLEAREIIDRLSGAVTEQLRREIPWRPGALSLLSSLREAGVPQALVTMSEAPMAAAVIEGMGFDPFDARVTGDTVERGKPDPLPYLRGLEILAGLHGPLEASRCVGLEDSVPGTASAMEAGLVTVGIPLHVGLPRHADLHLLPSLDGVTPQHLGEVVAADRARRRLPA